MRTPIKIRPRPMKWQLQLTKLGYEIPRKKTAARELWKRVMQGLLDSGKTITQIAEMTDWQMSSLAPVLRAHGVRRQPVIHTCPCGCGKTWDTALASPGKMYFSLRCKRIHLLQQYEAGLLTLVKVNICEECGTEIRVVRELPETDKRTCSMACAKALRKGARAVAMSEANQQWCGPGWTYGTATNELRATYCHQRTEAGDLVACKHYRETCGEGCFRKDDAGRPSCYEPAPMIRARWSHPAIDCTRPVAL